VTGAIVAAAAVLVGRVAGNLFLLRQPTSLARRRAG